MYYEVEAYQKMYYYLFNCIEDVVNILDESPFGHLPVLEQVRDMLISAQNTCEEIYLDSEQKQENLMESADMSFSERLDQLERKYFPEKEIHALNNECLNQFAEEHTFSSKNIDIPELSDIIDAV